MKNSIQTMDVMSMKTKAAGHKETKKVTDIPEGYITSEEFADIFEQKLLAAYENL